VEAHPLRAFGQDSGRAGVPFLGPERIDVLRFGPAADQLIRVAILRHAPAAVISSRGTRRLRDAGRRTASGTPSG
jgi:hypothetical protein